MNLNAPQTGPLETACFPSAGIIHPSSFLSIRHLVVVEAKMVPDLVHDRIAHFLHHFFFRATEPEDRPAIDGNFCRQLPAGLEEGFFVDGKALIEAEEVLVFLHFQIGPYVWRWFFLHYHRDVGQELGILIRQAIQRLLDERLKVLF